MCERCLSLVEAKIIFEHDNVYYLKYCPQHGHQKTLISTDVPYFKLSRQAFHGYAPMKFLKTPDKGCPYDCGLCEAHEQHCAAAVIEILDDCNMRCPTCIAGSFPGAANRRTIEEIAGMLTTATETEGSLDILMISGGEPTIHPDIIQILTATRKPSIEHVFVITNGIRIANDIDFVKRLRDHGERLEVYLQFDSLRRNALLDIRGEDLRSVRERALNNLQNIGVSTTLVCVVKKAVNDDEINEIIRFATKYKCIRGVTFQPIREAGRNEGFDRAKHAMTLSEVRTPIVRESGLFRDEDMIPHPCNPASISVGYLLRAGGALVPATSSLFDDVDGGAEHMAGVFPHASEFRSTLYFLPKFDAGRYRYDQLFRVTIVEYLDRFNFCTAAVKQNCIAMITRTGLVVPIDLYFLGLYS